MNARYPSASRHFITYYSRQLVHNRHMDAKMTGLGLPTDFVVVQILALVARRIPPTHMFAFVLVLVLPLAPARPINSLPILPIRPWFLNKHCLKRLDTCITKENTTMITTINTSKDDMLLQPNRSKIDTTYTTTTNGRPMIEWYRTQAPSH
jgi:hypothetical protein